MKRILIVAGRLYIGGAERICRNIGFHADPLLFQIDYLVFGNHTDEYEPDLDSKGCGIIHMDSPEKGHLKFYTNLVRLLRENRYDVVHCHTMFNSGIVLRAAKQCGVPVRIAHSHSIRGPEPRGPVKNTYEQVMRRWILRYVTHWIGCGREAGNWLFGEKAFSEKGIVLLNGIDLEQFRFDSSARDSIRAKHQLENSFVIGHVGHLAAVKNQVFLIRLMPKVLERRPDAHLLLLGEGGDRSMLEQEIRTLCLENAVTMTGNVDNVNQYLSAMDVFAFPSLYEGMPLSIIEVQANGLPCVISNRVPKDVFLTDLLHPLSLEGQAEEWAKMLLNLHRTDPEPYQKTLRQSGFDVHQMLERIYQIYQEEDHEDTALVCKNPL